MSTIDRGEQEEQRSSANGIGLLPVAYLQLFAAWADPEFAPTSHHHHQQQHENRCPPKRTTKLMPWSTCPPPYSPCYATGYWKQLVNRMENLTCQIMWASLFFGIHQRNPNIDHTTYSFNSQYLKMAVLRNWLLCVRELNKRKIKIESEQSARAFLAPQTGRLRLCRGVIDHHSWMKHTPLAQIQAISAAAI